MLVRRVLLVDDHPEFASSAHALLTHDGFDIVGVAGTGEDALEMCRLLQPELLLLDIHLPGISGLDVAEELSRADRPPLVILISSDTDAGTDPDVLGAPVSGFLPKRDLTCAAIDALLC
jgi:DNA-binding NarL/FixJ family response regulator